MDHRQHLLLKLMEECAEVSQRASKQMQFGRDEYQPNQAIPWTNSERLRDEINDLLAVVKMLEEVGEIPKFDLKDFDKHLDMKRGKIRKYLKYSESLGMVKE